MGAPNEPFTFLGHGANVVGSLGSGSLVQDMPYDLSFDGDGDWVLVNDQTLESTFQDSFTVSAWVKPLDGQNNEQRAVGILGTWASSIGALAIQATGKVTFTYTAAGNQGVAGTVEAIFPAGQSEWRHILATADETVDGPGGLQIYIDGEHATLSDSVGGGSSGSTTGVTFGDFAAPSNCYVQGGALNSDYEYSGSMRDLSVWSTKLTDSQITDVFKGDLSSTDQELWWKLDDNNATAQDSTSNNRDGTVTNSTWGNSEYNLNQIGSGSVSGSVTVSGGTWNLRDSTYMSFDGINDYIDSNTNLSTILTGSHTISTWCKLTDGHPTSTESLWGSRNSPLDDSCELYISSTGKITYWYMAGGVDEYASSDAAVFVDNATGWHHVVATMQYNSASSATMKLYVDGAEVTLGSSDGGFAGNMANWSSSIAMAFGGSNNNDIPERFLDGKMRGFRIYDSALTSSQIDLLYKGQWDGAPVHWWKLNDGSGDTIVDSGLTGTNGTNNDATWVKPDYDMLAEGGTAGTLVTISGAKLSAPQAELQLGQAGVHSIAADTYIHNSGTLLLDGNTGAGVNSHFYDYGNTYYKVIKTGSGWTHGWHSSANDDTIVENMFTLTQSNTRFYNRLTMGTTGSKGIIQIDGTDVSSLVGYGGFELYGVSELYPVLVSSSNGTGNWSLRASPTVLSNIEVDMDWTTFGDTITHTLSGNCKFAGLDISATDTFDASGQRVEIGGLDGASACTMDFTDSLVYLTARYDSYIYRIFNAATFTPTRSTFVCDMSNAGNALGQMQSDQSFDNLAIVNDGLNLASGYLSCTGNLIIAAGGGSNNKLYSSDGNSGINVSGNVNIANGATYEPDDDIATIGGNFNMAGGFIGVGALDVTGVPTVSAEYMEAASFTDMSAATEGTIECWFKADSSVSLDQAGMINPFNTAAWNITVSRPAGISYLGWEWDNGGTEIWMQNGVALTDDAWHHAAMTIHETNGYKVYLDAKLVASGAALGNSASKASPTLSIGATQYGGSPSGYENRCFDGGIARGSVWKAALTEAEIRSMMFQDWVAVSGSSVDQTKCVAWYEFSDDQDLTSISDMSGSGNTGTLTTTGAWAGPGTFTYGTSTLKFDNAGTSYLYAPRSGPTPACSGLTITDGTTLTIDNPGRDFYCYGLLVNSGTTTANHNFQYRNRSMPIVGASSDLKMGTRIFYYFGDGSGLPASGAGTNYYQLRPGTEVWMQGDFDCQSDIIQSGGDLHLNGYKCSTSEIYNYGGGNIWAEPGSSIEFDTTGGFNKMYGASPTTMTFAASGVAGANFRGVTSKGIVMNEATDIGRGSVYKGSFTISLWVYLPADMQPTLDVANGGFFGGGGGGQPGGGVDLWSYSASPSWYFDINGASGTERSAQSASIVAGDLGKLHHIVCVLDRSGGVDTGDGIQKLYQSISGEDATPQRIGSGSVNANFDGVSNTKLWTIGHAGLSYWTDGGGTSGPIIADFRIWKGGADGAVGALTDAQITTLYNGGDTTVNGTGIGYPDSTNSLNANTWYKLDRTSAGLTSLIDTVSGNNATYASAYTGQTGFVTINGTATPYEPINRIYPAGVTLTNTYMSGSKDIVVGQIYESTAGIIAHPSQTFTTKGTVVLD